MKNNKQTLTIRNIMEEVSSCQNWSFDKFIDFLDKHNLYVQVSSNMIYFTTLTKDTIMQPWFTLDQTFHIFVHNSSSNTGQTFNCGFQHLTACTVATYIKSLISQKIIDFLPNPI